MAIEDTYQRHMTCFTEISPLYFASEICSGFRNSRILTGHIFALSSSSHFTTVYIFFPDVNAHK